jgi:hypothetical protein
MSEPKHGRKLTVPILAVPTFFRFRGRYCMPIRVVVYQFLPSGAKRKVLMEDFMTADDAKR